MVAGMVYVTDLGGFDLFYHLLLFVGREACMESEKLIFW